MQKVKWR